LVRPRCVDIRAVRSEHVAHLMRAQDKAALLLVTSAIAPRAHVPVAGFVRWRSQRFRAAEASGSAPLDRANDRRHHVLPSL